MSRLLEDADITAQSILCRGARTHMTRALYLRGSRILTRKSPGLSMVDGAARRDGSAIAAPCFRGSA